MTEGEDDGVGPQGSAGRQSDRVVAVGVGLDRDRLVGVHDRAGVPQPVEHPVGVMAEQRPRGEIVGPERPQLCGCLRGQVEVGCRLGAPGGEGGAGSGADTVDGLVREEGRLTQSGVHEQVRVLLTPPHPPAGKRVDQVHLAPVRRQVEQARGGRQAAGARADHDDPSRSIRFVRHPSCLRAAMPSSRRSSRSIAMTTSAVITSPAKMSPVRSVDWPCRMR